MTTLLEQLQAQNPEFTDALLNPALNYLLASREAAGGDLDLNIILLVIAIRSAEHPDLGKLSEKKRLEETPVFPSLGVNTRSIADSSGIPRETVRRKVAELVKKGWIVREGSNLHFTAQAWKDLAAVREAREQLAVRYYEIVRRLALRAASAGP